MNKKLKKLKIFTTASFAVWPFNPDVDFKKIHNRVVIIGLNPSAKIKFGENFHKKRFDSWYAEGFSKSPFAGAYMTDLISNHEPNSLVIIKRWENMKFKRNNIRNLEKQFKILGIKESTPILCIGQNTRRLFSSAFTDFKRILGVNHPNSYRMKNNRKIFLEDIKKIGKKM